mgnify:CR=1 FL=1
MELVDSKYRAGLKILVSAVQSRPCPPYFFQVVARHFPSFEPGFLVLCAC